MALRFHPTVEIAAGADIADGYPTTWSWTDITAYTRKTDRITITRGRQDRYAQTAPASCSLTLLNPSGIWVPDNPLSPYYGIIDQNTPLRILNRANDNRLSDGFNRTASSSWGSADSGGAWTNSGGSASDFSVSAANGGRHLHTATATRHASLLGLSIIRSDQTVRIRVNASSTGAAQTAGIALRWVDANNHCRAELAFNVGGTILLRFVTVVAGVDTIVAAEVTGLTHSPTTWVWLRVQTGSTAVRVKAWQDGATEPVTWNLDGADSTAAAALAGLLGLHSLRETSNTNTNATFDFDSYSMIDGPGIQFTGYVAEWPTSWADASENVSLAQITAYGQLQRINSGRALKSAMFRVSTNATYSGGQDAVGYWPMEDGNDATQFGSGLSGGLPMSYFDMSLGADSTIPGSQPLPTGGAGATFSGRVAAYPSATKAVVSWIMKIPAAPSATTGLIAWSMPGGTITKWVMYLSTGNQLTLSGFNSAGADVLGGATTAFTDGYGNSLYGRQVYFEVRAVQNGGNIDWDWTVWSAANDSDFLTGNGQTGSVAATIANVGSVWHSAYPGLTAGGYTVGHATVRTAENSDAYLVACTGYVGELTGYRFGRLASEENVPAYYGDLLGEGSPFPVQEMGAQAATSMMAQFREIEATEEGILFDGKQGQLTLLPRSQRQNHAVNLTLDRELGQVAWPFSAIRDDYLLRTEVTVNRVGSSRGAIASDAVASRRVGVYTDTVTVNNGDDTELQSRARWRLNMGSTREIRYPSVPLNLTRNQSLIAAWLNMDIGSRIAITNLPAGLPPDDLDLLIEGYTEVMDSQEWNVTLNTSPARPWNVFTVQGGGNKGRLGTTSTLVTGVNSTAVTLSVATAAGNALWRSGAVNFDIGAAGERMTVTNISGTTSPQTFTVTRSVNGVVKAQAAAATIKLWRAGVWAL